MSSIKEKLHNLLSFPYAPEYRQGFEVDYAQRSYWPTIGTGMLVALFEAVMLVITSLNPGMFPTAAIRGTYILLYAALLAVSVLMVGAGLFFKRRLATSPHIFFRLVFIYSVFICLWAVLLTVHSHQYSTDIIVYVYCILFTATLVPLRPWQTLLVFAGSEATLCLLLALFAGPDQPIYGSIINSTIATLLSIVVSNLLYHSKARDYYNRVTIVQQNEEISKINAALSDLVYTDDLTRAANRRYMDEVLPERLRQARSIGQPVAVMMLDLDHFKQYNDLYGHQAGDVCLQEFSRVIRAFLRAQPGHFVRYGGEEFILFLPGMDEPTAKRAAENIRTRLLDANIAHNGSSTGQLTISVGVRVSPAGEDIDLDELISDADQALYIAKNSGRNRVKLFYPIPGTKSTASNS